MVSWNIEDLVDFRTILACVFFMISVYLTFKLRKKKSLAYEITTSSSLISVKKEIESDVNITFRGKKVEDVYLLKVKIINNGYDHVKEEDFKKPITFVLNPEVEIMDMSVSERSSESNQISFSLKDQNVVEIVPTLLNKKDWFIVNFLLSRYVKFDLSLHAVDMEDIKVFRDPKRVPLILFISLLLFSFWSLIWFLTRNEYILFFAMFAACAYYIIESRSIH